MRRSPMNRDDIDEHKAIEDLCETHEQEDVGDRYEKARKLKPLNETEQLDKVQRICWRRDG